MLGRHCGASVLNLPQLERTQMKRHDGKQEQTTKHCLMSLVQWEKEHFLELAVGIETWKQRLQL